MTRLKRRMGRAAVVAGLVAGSIAGGVAGVPDVAQAATCNGTGGQSYSGYGPAYWYSWATLESSAASNCQIATALKRMCPGNQYWMHSQNWKPKGSVSGTHFYIGGCAPGANGWYTRQV